MRSIAILITLCGLAVSMVTPAGAQELKARHSAAPRLVVFVCEHGSVKSLVAMEYFNRGARARGLGYTAVARGTEPQPTVPRAIEEGLQGDGFDVSAFEPRKLDAADVDRASLIVSFDQDVASVAGDQAHYLQWDDLPALLTHYTRGKAAIVQHVDALLDELALGASH